MLPNAVLSTMRAGLMAGVAVTAGTGLLMAEDVVTPKAAQVCKPVVPLTAEQLEQFNKLLPDLGSKDVKADAAAYEAINKMGKGALEPLKKAEKEAKDTNVKYRINYLIQYIASDGNYCPPCGRG